MKHKATTVRGNRTCADRNVPLSLLLSCCLAVFSHPAPPLARIPWASLCKNTFSPLLWLASCIQNRATPVLPFVCAPALPVAHALQTRQPTHPHVPTQIWGHGCKKNGKLHRWALRRWRRLSSRVLSQAGLSALWDKRNDSRPLCSAPPPPARTSPSFGAIANDGGDKAAEGIREGGAGARERA